jgi:hypothetical protein
MVDPLLLRAKKPPKDRSASGGGKDGGSGGSSPAQSGAARGSRARGGPRDDGGSKRGIGGDIASNRGLTKQRAREKKNPRVRHRLQYEKRMKKHQHGKRGNKAKLNAMVYAGEATGINVRAVRSRSLADYEEHRSKVLRKGQ